MPLYVLILHIDNVINTQVICDKNDVLMEPQWGYWRSEEHHYGRPIELKDQSALLWLDGSCHLQSRAQLHQLTHAGANHIVGIPSRTRRCSLLQSLCMVTDNVDTCGTVLVFRRRLIDALCANHFKPAIRAAIGFITAPFVSPCLTRWCRLELEILRVGWLYLRSANF